MVSREWRNHNVCGTCKNSKTRRRESSFIAYQKYVLMMMEFMKIVYTKCHVGDIVVRNRFFLLNILVAKHTHRIVI